MVRYWAGITEHYLRAVVRDVAYYDVPTKWIRDKTQEWYDLLSDDDKTFINSVFSTEHPDTRHGISAGRTRHETEERWERLKRLTSSLRSYLHI